jgi:hypothetical protein
MTKYAYGISSFLIGDIDPATGLQINPTEIKESVYRDTFNWVEQEGATTDHYSEMDSTPKISFTEAGKETITLQIMETQADLLVKFLGGTVTVVDLKNVWHKPTSAPAIEMFIDITTEDGTNIKIPRARVSGRKNFQFRRNNIWLVDVTITPMTPLLGTLDAIEITDPA